MRTVIQRRDAWWIDRIREYTGRRRTRYEVRHPTHPTIYSLTLKTARLQMRRAIAKEKADE